MNLGLYIHVPFCKHACPYCDFYKIELRDRPARDRLDFCNRVAREWELLRATHPEISDRPIETIYFGGGTPSTLRPDDVRQLIAAFSPAPNAEVTLEANPENLTPGRCEKWRAAGIGRLSVGVQSFEANELRLLERLHEPALIPEAIGNARAAGIENISVDLMFALPNQTMAVWQSNVSRALDLAPQHISLYGLTYHTDTAFENWRVAGRLAEIDEDLQAAMYDWACDAMLAAGFEHYEISNFALPGYRSKHNRRYWRREDVVGLGPGAHSNLGGERWFNFEDLDAWAADIERGELPRRDLEAVSAEMALGEKLYTMLRTDTGINRESEPELFVNVCGALETLGRRDLYVSTPDNVRLTRAGWLLSNAIVREVLK